MSALFTELSPLLPALQEHIDPLRARYDAEGRHYHSWAHVDALLAAYRDAKHLVNDEASILIAILYHDAVYDPRATDNERKSAELMLQDCDGHVPPRVLIRAHELVLATETHEIPGSDDPDFTSDCGLFLDIDLSVLGGDEEMFTTYETQVRAEFSYVPVETYNQLRAAVLQRFLNRDRIYHSEFFYERLEQTARRNLKASLARLT